MKESIWEMDITHHMVATLAVFALATSSLVACAGVAALGVETQVALAQNPGAFAQAAAVMLGEGDGPRPPHVLPLPTSVIHTGSSTPTLHSKEDGPTGDGHDKPQMPPMATIMCPKITQFLMKGSRDASTTDVA